GISRRSGEEVRFVGEADFDERSLGCIAEVPQGGLAWLMEGDDRSVLEATVAACGDALTPLEGRPPLGFFAFDCIARRGVLVERAAEALEAEVGAVVRGGSVESVVGFPEGAEPVDRLVAIADGRSDTIDVPGLGTCHAVSVPLTGRPPGRLLLARLAGGFDIEEANLIRGMARVLSLSLEVLRALEAERTLREESERQAGEKADLAATLEQRQ